MKVGLLFPNSSPKQVKVNFNETVSSQDGGEGRGDSRVQVSCPTGAGLAPTSSSSRRPVGQGRKPHLPGEESSLCVLIRAPPDAESEPRSWVQKFLEGDPKKPKRGSEASETRGQKAHKRCEMRLHVQEESTPQGPLKNCGVHPRTALAGDSAAGVSSSDAHSSLAERCPQGHTNCEGQARTRAQVGLKACLPVTKPSTFPTSTNMGFSCHPDVRLS